MRFGPLRARELRPHVLEREVKARGDEHMVVSTHVKRGAGDISEKSSTLRI